MTFNIIVPNNNQSPGVFPAQNNTNFQRLRDNINNDHNFTDASSVAQSIHKQVTLINRTPPVGLPAGNGILFSAPDALAATQLWFYNGTNTYQITPTAPTTLKVTGSVNLATGASALAYTVTGDCQGFITAVKQSSGRYSSYVFTRAGGNISISSAFAQSSGGGQPTAFLTGFDLYVMNSSSGSTGDVAYYINVNY